MFRIPSKWRDVPADMAAEVLFRIATFVGFFVAAYGIQWAVLGIFSESLLNGPGVRRMLDSPLSAEGFLSSLATLFLYTSLITAALASTVGVTRYRYMARRRYDQTRAAAQGTESASFAAPDRLPDPAERMSEPDPAPVQPEAPRRQERQPRSESMWTQLELPKERPETREQ